GRFRVDGSRWRRGCRALRTGRQPKAYRITTVWRRQNRARAPMLGPPLDAPWARARHRSAAARDRRAGVGRLAHAVRPRPWCGDGRSSRAHRMVTPRAAARRLAAGLVLLLLLVHFPPAQAGAQTRTGEFVAGELLVRFKAGTPSIVAAELHRL